MQYVLTLTFLSAQHSLLTSIIKVGSDQPACLCLVRSDQPACPHSLVRSDQPACPQSLVRSDKPACPHSLVRSDQPACPHSLVRVYGVCYLDYYFVNKSCTAHYQWQKLIEMSVYYIYLKTLRNSSVV
jgi:hypothetical protein